jgi:hypothetical protein
VPGAATARTAATATAACANTDSVDDRRAAASLT